MKSFSVVVEHAGPDAKWHRVIVRHNEVKYIGRMSRSERTVTFEKILPALTADLILNYFGNRIPGNMYELMA